jgi:hypothetical protein
MRDPGYQSLTGAIFDTGSTSCTFRKKYNVKEPSFFIRFDSEMGTRGIKYPEGDIGADELAQLTANTPFRNRNDVHWHEAFLSVIN